MAGKVAEKIGITDYKVVDTVGRESHKHIDQLRQRKRSSLICPSSPSRIEEHTRTSDEVTGDRKGPNSPKPSQDMTSDVITGVDDVPDQFQDCEEPSTPGPMVQPPLPSPGPTQSRPTRQCRIDKIPNYKV